MRTNIVLDSQLTDEALVLTGLQTKRELVELALRELIRHKKAEQASSLQQAFIRLHQISGDDNPFPEITRQDRTNLFAEEL